MIRSSEEVGELAKALATAQGEFPVIPKSHTGKITGQGKNGPYEYSYRYADLADCVAAAQPILTANGLAVTQFPSWDGVSDTLDTRVMHESGQWVENTMRLFLAKEDPQAHGSATTYGKRYAYCAALGIVADEDDDGAVATATSAPTVRRAAPTRPAQPSNRAAGTAQAMADRAATHAPDPNLISEKQIKLVSVLFGKKGFPDDRTTRHAYVGSVIEREFASTKELTKGEASTLIDALNAMPDGGFAVEYGPGEEPFEDEEF